MNLHNPRMVTEVEPIDVSTVRDPGMQAIILMARSLGWNVLQKLNQPVVITAIDGHQRRIPTNTSIRSGVYQGHLSGIITHSEHYVPTPQLVESIISLVKPNRDQANRMRKAVGDLFEKVTVEASATEDPEPLSDEEWTAFAEATGIDDEAAPSGGSTDLPEGDPEQQPAPTVVSEEPELSAWAREDHGGSFALRRTWSDGSIDYRCKICPFAGDNIKSIQGHWMWHVRRMEAPRIDDRVHLAPDDPGVERAVTERGAMSGAKALDMVRQISQILGVNDRRDEIQRLREEVIALRKENRQLKADWKALRAMLRQGP